MFRSGAQLLLLVALVGLVLMRESRLEPARSLDEAFADFIATRAQRPQEVAPVTLVTIDESSLRTSPWPWSPLDYARFFQAAEILHPSVLAVDEVLQWEPKSLSPEAARKLPQYRSILRDRVLRAEKVLTAARLGYPEDPAQPPPLQETPLLRKVSGDPGAVREFTAIEAQAEEDFRLSGTVGFTNLVDPSSASRRVPLLLRYRGQIVPSFALQALMLWEKLSPDDVSVELGRKISLGSRGEIPIDAEGCVRVDFGLRYGRCEHDEMILTSDQVQNGRTPLVATEKLTGKLLLLGRTDAAARTLTLGPGIRASESELLAAAIATLQQRSFLRRAALPFEIAIIAAFMGFAWICRRRSKGFPFLWLPPAFAAYLLVSLGLFSHTLIVLPLMLPAGLALFITLYRLTSPKA